MSEQEAKCRKCYGRGWYPHMVEGVDDDYLEKYCDCPDGDRLKRNDGAFTT